MPMDTKKTAPNTSRSGVTSRSARCPVGSDLEMTSPARNAPIAAERPIELVIAAIAKASATTVTMKDSRAPTSATRPSTHGMPRRPSTNTRPRARATFAAPAPRSTRNEVPPPASAGSTATMGMNARSWSSRMPVVTRPWREPTAPRSDSVFITTMVLLRERTMPSTMAWAPSHPSARPMA